MNITPLSALRQTLRLALAGRLHFPKTRLGYPFESDGETWIIFREAIISPAPDQPAEPGAIFQPRFHLAHMPAQFNRVFSWIPALFILGLPGFRSKLWLFNPTCGDFSGYYEWDTVQDAVNYQHSWAGAYMTRRSLPGSVSFKIISQ